MSYLEKETFNFAKPKTVYITFPDTNLVVREVVNIAIYKSNATIGMTVMNLMISGGERISYDWTGDYEYHIQSDDNSKHEGYYKEVYDNTTLIEIKRRVNNS